MSEGGANAPPSEVDLARALQLAAREALGGGGDAGDGFSVGEPSGHASADEKRRSLAFRVDDGTSTSSNVVEQLSPFGHPLAQQVRHSDGGFGGHHRRKYSNDASHGQHQPVKPTRTSCDSMLPCLGTRTSRPRSSTTLSSDRSVGPMHQTAASLLAGTGELGLPAASAMMRSSGRSSFDRAGTDSYHSYGYSQGLPSSGMSPVPVRASIDVVRPSLGRGQVERTTYEELGPPTIIRDADGQEYLIQPIRESLDRSALAGRKASIPADVYRSGSLALSGEMRSQTPGATPAGSQSPQLKKMDASVNSGLSMPFSNSSSQSQAPAQKQLAGTNSNILSELSRMNLNRGTSITSITSITSAGMSAGASTGMHKDGSTPGSPVAATRRTPSGTLVDDQVTTNATDSGASGGHVGQLYLSSLRHSAPISIGVRGSHGPNRVSAGDVYASAFFRQPGSYVGSHAGSVDSMNDFLNQHSDAYGYDRRRFSTDGRDLEWEIDIHDIHFGPRIGRGAYGEVFKCVYRETDVAVKLFIDQDFSDKVLEAFRKEVDILKKLRHPNILHFMGYCTVPPHMCIVTEYEKNGSLFKLLHRTKAQLDEGQKLNIALEIAIGMHYLHTSKPPIVHGDLKSPNLLLGNRLHVKICDFGLSRFRMASKLSAGSKLGTPEWTAPEVLQSSTNSEAGDVYSYGVVLWEIFTGQIPWEDVSAMQVVLMVGFHNSRLAIPEDVPRWAAEIIECCFDQADKRPSFAEIIRKLRDVKTRLIDLRGVSRTSGEGI